MALAISVPATILCLNNGEQSTFEEAANKIVRIAKGLQITAGLLAQLSHKLVDETFKLEVLL